LPDLRQQEVFPNSQEVIPCETILVLLRALIRLVYVEAITKKVFRAKTCVGLSVQTFKIPRYPWGLKP